MKKEALLKLRKPLHIVLSISLFVAGICLMAACVGIYRSGDKPFTPASVAAAFGPISLPVFLCLGPQPAPTHTVCPPVAGGGWDHTPPCSTPALSQPTPHRHPTHSV